MKRVYISVINDLVTDQRLHRMVGLLTDQKFDVTCFGRKRRESPDLDHSRFRHRRFRMIFQKGPLFYACYNVRLFLNLIFVKAPEIFIAIDLDTLPASYLASRIRRVKLLYDSHEFFTQVPELIDRKVVQRIWKWIEGRLVPRLDYAITVSPSIAEIYRKLYGTRFRVVRNVPVKRNWNRSAEKLDDFGDKKIIIYQGAVNVGRGLELVIEAMRSVEHALFIVAGEGDILGDLKNMAEEKGLSEKVRFLGRLTPDQLFPLTCSASLGISLEEDRGLNYRYALPNKLFDYIQARIPVLCTALPEMARIVDTFGVGISTSERDPEKLAEIIRFMLEERGRESWMEALEKAAGELNWETESEVFLEVLSGMGIPVSYNN